METVKIICCEEHIHDAEAHVFGQWAASRCLTDGCQPAEYWTVTLVPSGRCIASQVGRLSEVKAMRVAIQLAKAIPFIPNRREVSADVKLLIVETAERALIQIEEESE